MLGAVVGRFDGFSGGGGGPFGPDGGGQLGPGPGSSRFFLDPNDPILESATNTPLKVKENWQYVGG